MTKPNNIEYTKDGKIILHGVFQTFDRHNGHIYDYGVYLQHIIDLEKKMKRESRTEKILEIFKDDYNYNNVSEDILKRFAEKRYRNKLYYTDEEWRDTLKKWKRVERIEKMNSIFGEDKK